MEHTARKKIKIKLLEEEELRLCCFDSEGHQELILKLISI